MTLSLSRRAVLWGERTAVIETSEGRRYSYADLGALAERFARKLAGRGVEPGDRIALLSRNRIETLALVFATRRLGCALASVSPYRSKSGISGLVDRLDPRLVLHEDAQSDRLRKVRETTTLGELSEVDPAEYEPADSPPDPWLLFHAPAEEDATVYAFSSRAVERNCIAGTTAWGLGRSRVANLASLFRTDGLLVGTLPALYAGGTVVLHRAFRPDPALSLIERHDATHVYGTPLEFDRLTEAEGFSMANFASVEAFYSSAPLPAELHDAYLLQDRPVGRLFGTPAVPHLLTFPPERDDAVEKGGSVGRPVLDCEVRIADGQLEARGPVIAEGTLDGAFEGWVGTGVRARRDDDGDYWIED
ncbi:AMP-binding protein [Halalkalicoccus sp. NIPERK01]|uniref:AMP-binding protein n=1 Tax=Halalkalicoccus sp. NIPERK01 TaxID=3053469 RepID=UPI00256E9CDD|nr:AMP-binding protein [Halalkalicoccus sp. NIPERK01]MDL5361045.1 AMP-binding protein [Halalkalicoccus sp. NIPERK01]